VPHLRIELNKAVSEATRKALSSRVRSLFAEIMQTGTDHIAATIAEYPTEALNLGRVTHPEQGVSLIQADIREGRTFEQRRRLAVGLIHIVEELVQVPANNMYVTITEHKGEDFHLAERYLQSWKQGDDPLAGE